MNGDQEGVHADEMDVDTIGRPTMGDSAEPGASAASEMDAALESGPTPKKHAPPKILDKLDLREGGAAAEEKEVQGDGHAQSSEEASVRPSGAWRKAKVEMLLIRGAYLLERAGCGDGPPRKELGRGHAEKAEAFQKGLEVSSLEEVLSKEEDPVFLQRLVDDVLGIRGAEGANVAPPTNAAPSVDPVLECLAAAPSRYGRADAELLAPILGAPILEGANS